MHSTTNNCWIEYIYSIIRRVYLWDYDLLEGLTAVATRSGSEYYLIEGEWGQYWTKIAGTIWFIIYSIYLNCFNNTVNGTGVGSITVLHERVIIRIYLISARNCMLGRALWDKLLECIFENFEIARVKRRQFQIFQKSQGWFFPKIARNKDMITG